MKSVLVGIAFFVALGAAAQQQPQQAAPPKPRQSCARRPRFRPSPSKAALFPSPSMWSTKRASPSPASPMDDFEIKEDNKPQKISIFDKESVTPLSIVLAIDASESVFSDEHLEREAAKKFIRSILRPQDQIDLMEFDDFVRELVPFTNDAGRLDEGLGRMTRGASTAMYDAIYLASDLLQGTKSDGGRRVIVMITDGEDTTHHGNYPSALEEAQRAGAMIYALIIVPIHNDAGRNTGGEHALIQMASDTGGKYFYVEDKRDLGPAFQHVSDDLRTQYTLGYYAPQHGGDIHGFRHIDIQLKDPALRAKYTLRYRNGYYSGKK